MRVLVRLNTDTVADLAFALMLSLARRIPEADRETKDGNWKKIIGNAVYGGGIIDEGALYHALKDGYLRCAALDGYLNDSPEGSPLRELDNIIMTSHNGAYTEEAIANMGIQVA